MSVGAFYLYNIISSELEAYLHVEAAGGVCMLRSPAEGLITDTGIHFTEVKTDHRVDKHCTPISVLSIDGISEVEGEEWLETTHTATYVSPYEDRDKGTVVEVPLLGDTDAGAETDVLGHHLMDTALHIEAASMSTCDNRLEFNERSDSECGGESGYNAYEGK